MLLAPIALAVTLNNAAFTVSQDYVGAMLVGETHLLSGEAPDDQHATLTATCGDGCALKPYSLRLGPSDTKQRAFNGTLAFKNGTTLDVVGTMTLAEYGFFSITVAKAGAAGPAARVASLWPATTCQVASTRETCNEMTLEYDGTHCGEEGKCTCAWCTSGTHALCFHAEAKPPEPKWSCDKPPAPEPTVGGPCKYHPCPPQPPAKKSCEQMDIGLHPNCDAAGYGCVFGACGVEQTAHMGPRCTCKENHPPPSPPSCEEQTSEAACAGATSTCTSSAHSPKECVWIPAYGACQCASPPSCAEVKDEAKCATAAASCDDGSGTKDCVWIPSFGRCGCASEAASS